LRAGPRAGRAWAACARDAGVRLETLPARRAALPGAFDAEPLAVARLWAAPVELACPAAGRLAVDCFPLPRFGVTACDGAAWGVVADRDGDATGCRALRVG
jgi:hypothetical protein